MEHTGVKRRILFLLEKGYKLTWFQANPEMWSSIKWAVSGLLCPLTLPFNCLSRA